MQEGAVAVANTVKVKLGTGLACRVRGVGWWSRPNPGPKYKQERWGTDYPAPLVPTPSGRAAVGGFEPGEQVGVITSAEASAADVIKMLLANGSAFSEGVGVAKTRRAGEFGKPEADECYHPA